MGHVGNIKFYCPHYIYIYIYIKAPKANKENKDTFCAL